MANGKGIVLAIAGLGGVALLARAASAAPAAKQQTYVDKTLARTQAAKSAKVEKAKAVARKGTAEVQSAVNAINNLLK